MSTAINGPRVLVPKDVRRCGDYQKHYYVAAGAACKRCGAERLTHAGAQQAQHLGTSEDRAALRRRAAGLP